MSKFSKTILVNITKEQEKYLEDRFGSLGVPYSETVRFALDEFKKNHPVKKEEKK